MSNEVKINKSWVKDWAKWAKNELKLYSEKVKADTNSNIEAHPEEAEDEKYYSEKFLYDIFTVDKFVDLLEKDEKIVSEDINIISTLIFRLNRRIVLTDLNSFEERSDEWITEETDDSIYLRNKRRVWLIGRKSKIDDETKYADRERFTYYDIISNGKLTITNDILDEKKKDELFWILSDLIPIKFPYSPENVTVYIELFSCTLQGNAEPVKTLSLCYYIDDFEKKCGIKPHPIQVFFDISGDELEEIPLKSYAIRRQIYENSHKNDTI